VAKYKESLRGREGIEKGPYSLILMDYSMPEMSGPEAVQLMKQMRQPGDHASTFVCVSAYSEGSVFE